MYRRSLKREIVSVLVDNQANVLTRVVSMFGRRGFNIDSLTVSATNDPTLSRITIVFSATERSMQQIITQTEKLERAIRYFQNAGFEVGVWINNLGHGMPLSHEQKVVTQSFTEMEGIRGDKYGYSYC